MEILSYVLMVVTLVGTLAVSFKKKYGFYIWVITNAFWIIYNLYIKSYPQMIVYVANLITSIIGILYWNKQER